MKRNLSLFFLFAVLLPFAPLSAKEKNHHPMSEKDKKHFAAKQAGRMLRRFDTNGDGVLDKAEIAVMLEERRSHEGRRAVVPKSSQVAPYPSKEMVDRAGKIIEKFDKDGDGTLDRKELAGMIEQRWKHHKLGGRRHHHHKPEAKAGSPETAPAAAKPAEAKPSTPPAEPAKAETPAAPAPAPISPAS